MRVRIDRDGVHIRFATFSRDEAEVIAEKITRILKRLKGGTDAKFKAAFKVAHGRRGMLQRRVQRVPQGQLHLVRREHVQTRLKPQITLFFPSHDL
ncbi:MAG: hypothetical protein QXJ59_06650 [Thermofilaceae archaeon]